MGILDDFFGTSTPQPSGGGLLDAFFGEYGQPTMPLCGHASGHGDQPFDDFASADKSTLMDGVVRDPDTHYVGTPSEIYDRYIAEGRNPSRLLKNFRKR